VVAEASPQRLRLRGADSLDWSAIPENGACYREYLAAIGHRQGRMLMIEILSAKLNMPWAASKLLFSKFYLPRTSSQKIRIKIFFLKMANLTGESATRPESLPRILQI
jgi:hypothetical protein